MLRPYANEFTQNSLHCLVCPAVDKKAVAQYDTPIPRHRTLTLDQATDEMEIDLVGPPTSVVLIRQESGDQKQPRYTQVVGSLYEHESHSHSSRKPV